MLRRSTPLNDPAVRKQLENPGLQMPPKGKLTPMGSGTYPRSPAPGDD
ncbi:hypothetical protein GWE18_30070 [Bradyrhizobium sp. CSA112]|nr:hypothetical protein [Bradyrhizobium sp. CSA112]MDE5456998.1 hypothetical protein [Bradyrhizobium sp. CSA112]